VLQQVQMPHTKAKNDDSSKILNKPLRDWIIQFQYKPTYGPGISPPGVISVCSEDPVINAQHFAQQCVDETSGIENQTLLQKVWRVERLEFNFRCQEIKLQDVVG